MMTVTLVSPPLVEPLSLAEVKTQCGLESNDHDEILSDLISAATGWAENFTDRAFIAQTWDVTLDGFPDGQCVYLPKPPLISVTYVKYVDTSGTLTTWDEDNYTVELGTGPNAQQGRISRSETTLWPTTQDAPNAVTIRYRAGYGTTANDVPMILRVAMRQWVADAWSLRGNTVMGNNGVAVTTQSTDRLLTNFRTSWL